MHLAVLLCSQETHDVSGEPGSMGMSASDSYTSIGLDIEGRVLPCQQVAGISNGCTERREDGVRWNLRTLCRLRYCTTVCQNPARAGRDRGLCFRGDHVLHSRRLQGYQ